MTFLEKAWYKKPTWLYLLWPVSVLFMLVADLRRRYWLFKGRGSQGLDAHGPPLIVVGNITVGGTGKTPLVIALVKALYRQGIRAGVISRGYGGRALHYPLVVNEQSDPREVGDEAVVIVTNTHCPMVVDRNRNRALHKLLAEFQVDIVISDDGLQHYALLRDKEIVVIDGARKLGNRWCMPAGPLREPLSRLGNVDYIIYNGLSAEEGARAADQLGIRITATVGVMRQKPVSLVNLRDGHCLALDEAVSELSPQVDAVAGIGNPQGYFQLLDDLGFNPRQRIFPDHYIYTADDFSFSNAHPVVMTEKDAVKCRSFASKNFWYLKIEAQLEESFSQSLFSDIIGLTDKSTRVGQLG